MAESGEKKKNFPVVGEKSTGKGLLLFKSPASQHTESWPTFLGTYCQGTGCYCHGPAWDQHFRANWGWGGFKLTERKQNTKDLLTLLRDRGEGVGKKEGTNFISHLGGYTSWQK